MRSTLNLLHIPKMIRGAVHYRPMETGEPSGTQLAVSMVRTRSVGEKRKQKEKEIS